MDDSDIKRLGEILITAEEEEWLNTPDEHDQTETSTHQSYVTILKEGDIRSRMKEEIQRVSNTYSISEDDATLLLAHFRWDDIELHKKWSDNAKSVRESVGIFELERPLDLPSDDKNFCCGICFKLLSLERSASVSCGHRVCKFCWRSHINKSINKIADVDWYGTLKCPYDICRASVGGDMIEKFACEEDKTKYYRYLFRSYVEGSKVIKCCPAKGRSCDVHLTPGSGNFDVLCLCLLSFCWNCSKDVHSPMDCESAAKWLRMNSSDYQDPNWVRQNTVPCPRCNLRIRENQDCSLKMRCFPPCNYDFCWRCRGQWTEHGLDLYTCTHDEYEETVFGNMAEYAAGRYKDCHEKWMSNESLMQKAKAKLQQLHTDVIPDLSNKQLATVHQLEFVAEAWSQIMECRRVLKWTYAYEYYLGEDQVEKQDFLKLKQDNAEIPLEKLHYHAENQLNMLLDSDGPSENFNKFRSDLTDSTRITRNHYELLLRDLEDGLSNVVGASTSQRAHNEDDASGSSSIHDD
ncbi:probable E3 ubiquitin-protein ligase ARI12 [Brassica rapa]|uniref:probable E3 ubiquitin-protein ligase ARI12 n=1 Tax=Brassica campestris TaxID=3711 RepID=UPI0004F14977|nr:probable E3 ubiquitin-protein ligase ARI12 [Brassica rapa]